MIKAVGLLSRRDCHGKLDRARAASMFIKTPVKRHKGVGGQRIIAMQRKLRSMMHGIRATESVRPPRRDSRR